MKPVGDQDIQLIDTVKAHLKQIEPVAIYRSDEATLRVATGSLRFLLADGYLARAWSAAGIGGPMTFQTWCITSVGPSPVVAFCGGGDMLPGIPFSACRGASLGQKTLDLKSFCHSTRIQVEDIKISTVELIHYVANALGGSHFDPAGKAAKKPKAELLRKLESGEISAVPLRVNDRSLLHHEILSIAQTLARSKEVDALRAWAKS